MRENWDIKLSFKHFIMFNDFISMRCPAWLDKKFIVSVRVAGRLHFAHDQHKHCSGSNNEQDQLAVVTSQ